MDSFCDSWHRCFWCGVRGKCHPGFEPTELMKCRAINGLLCKGCLSWGYPPHRHYLQDVLRTVNVFSNYTTDHKQIADVVIQFAYPICAFPFLGFCYKCDPFLPGWICDVCDFYEDDAVAFEKCPAIENALSFQHQGRWIVRGDFGPREFELWRRLMRRTREFELLGCSIKVLNL